MFRIISAMNDTKYRFILVLLSLGLAAVIGLAIGFSPSGTESPLPEPLERIFPRANDSVPRGTAVEVDLKVGYQIDLYVDGEPIPRDEYAIQTGTNLVTWAPGPGRTIERWAPGVHELRIDWDRELGIPDPGSYTWTIRVQ